ESSARDQNLGPHRDGWYGAVVQMLGEKAWLLGDGADDPSAEPTLLLSPGDVLMVPKGVLHDVRTPDHSVHMAFALITDEPQLSPQNSPK
ncbi:MAG TPA: cupin domain-containing protein, partial [Candidatus Saccharimonadales bacterium]|nr:cupin domain-containing protein [Candidatus Saccharimonadales bacterium]